MKKLFVSYDISKKLKKYGFDEPCFCYYVDKNITLKTNISGYLSGIKYIDLHESYYLAPLYQQVIDWFENKNLFLYAFRINGKWQWKIDDICSYADYSVGDGFDTKYETLEQGIIECLKYIKQ